MKHFRGILYVLGVISSMLAVAAMLAKRNDLATLAWALGAYCMAYRAGERA